MQKIEMLAVSFPSLTRALGATPWDAEEFEDWACGPAPGHGALCAARFVLSVWNPDVDWRCGRFELMEALGCWDDRHRDAFIEWASAPWWP